MRTPRNKRGRSPILEALASVRSTLLSTAAFSAAINLLMLAPAIYMLQVYDRVLSSRNETTLLMLTLMILGLLAVMATIELLRGLVMVRVSTRLDTALNQRVYNSAFSANLRQGGFNAAQAMQHLTALRQFVTGSALFAFFDAPWFPLYLLCIFLFDAWLGAFALGGALLLIALALVNQRLSAKPLAAAGDLSIRSSNLAGASLRNAEAIEAMGMLGALRRRWLAVHEQFLQQHRISSERATAVTAITKGVRIALQSLVLGFAALLVVEERITAGMMIAASILMSRALAPIEALIGAWRQWGDARQAWHHLDTLLTTFPERAPGMPLPRPSGVLALENVSAAAPGSRAPILKGISCRVGPGSVLGLIGPSGSGKSTLARLLVGVSPALAGTARLDDADIFRWNKEELGPAVGYLPQEVELFAGSISENIARFGEPDAQQVVAAARLAGIHETILHFPQGYDTVLGEGGRGLSGGQKQRIGLARALYGRPALLVLDEPDASLDEQGAGALRKAIQAERERGCTIVLVSHRHNVLATATHLLAVANGRQQDFGEVQQVMARFAKQAPLAGVPRTSAASAQSSTETPATPAAEGAAT